MAEAATAWTGAPAAPRLRRQPLNAAEEEGILARCQAGDWHDYGRLVQRYQRLVWAAVDAVVMDKSAVPDIVQESFIRAFEKLHLYRAQASFATWLYRLARNVALSANRTAHRRPHHPSAAPVLERGLPTDQPEPGGHYLAQAQTEAVRRLLAALPCPYHEVIVLYYFYELNYEEIAAQLRLPLNTVRTRLRRARLQLFAAMRAEGWEER